VSRPQTRYTEFCHARPMPQRSGGHQRLCLIVQVWTCICRRCVLRLRVRVSIVHSTKPVFGLYDVRSNGNRRSVLPASFLAASYLSWYWHKQNWSSCVRCSYDAFLHEVIGLQLEGVLLCRCLFCTCPAVHDIASVCAYCHLAGDAGCVAWST